MPPPEGKPLGAQPRPRAGSVWPAMTIGTRTFESSSMSVRCAPSEPSRPLAVSTTCCSTSEASATSTIRRAISSSARCAARSAQLGGLLRNCSSESRSWRSRWRLSMAAAACSASERSSDCCCSLNAVGPRREDAKHAEWSLIGEHWCGDHRVDPDLGHDVIGHGVMGESLVRGVGVRRQLARRARVTFRRCRCRSGDGVRVAWPALRHR